MKKNGYINNRLRMNIMLRKNMNNNIKNNNNIKKTIKRNISSQRYLDMYNQNEKSINKHLHLLTPDINKKNIKKTNITFDEQYKLDNKEIINDNINLLSNSFDISTSFVNIEDYMNLYYNSNHKNPFLNKANNNNNNNKKKNDNNENNIKEKIIAKYSYKNKKWVLIEEYDNTNIYKSNKIYWKEFYNNNILKENNNNIQDFNIFEEKVNYLQLEYNKVKQLLNDLNNKYEQINKKNKESQIQLNNHLLKIKEVEKDKEKYLKKNKKLKEEINKIPYLIEKEMNKFREETVRKISKKIYELEQENKILKGERYKLDEKTMFDI